MRKDFHPAVKLQWEDDITASVTVPAAHVTGLPHWIDQAKSVKFCKNVEARFFQRPDDAIHRGYDKQTENDFSRPGNFFSNYEPLRAEKAAEMIRSA